MALTRRGEHPDVDPETGNLRDDAHLPPQQRDFNRMFADPGQREAFMQNVARWQSQLPEEVQREVQGRTFGAGADPWTGWEEYKRYIPESRTYWRGNELTSDDISRMSLEEFDAKFDSNGRPKQGYTFRASARDVLMDSSVVDPYSRDELTRRRGPER